MPSSSDLDLMALHVGALYVHDAGERLLRVNQWNGGVAPRLFLGRTAAGNCWRFRADLPTGLTLALTRLCREEPPLDIPDAPAVHRAEYLRLLGAHAPVERIWGGPAYSIPPQPAPASGVRAIDAADAHLLRGGLEAWIEDLPHRQPFLASVEADRAVAVCASVRISTAAHEAGVETLASHRRRGHASAVVSAWAQAVARLGALPLYSTAWENVASISVARGLRARVYGADFHIT